MWYAGETLQGMQLIVMQLTLLQIVCYFWAFILILPFTMDSSFFRCYLFALPFILH